MAISKSSTCNECGKAFARRPSALKLYKHSFCSQECYHKFTKDKGAFKAKNNPNYHGGKIVLCENCGNKIWKIPTRLHNTKYHACSQQCWNILRKRLKLHAGNKNPKWRGGISREPYGWDFDDALRELIRKRDRYKCQLCQTPQEECFQRLSIHHIDYDKQNSDPKNLIALCKKCHEKTNTNRERWTAFLNTKIQKEIYAYSTK